MQIPLEDKSKIKIQTCEISPNSKYKPQNDFDMKKIDLKSPINKVYIHNKF